MKLCNALLYKSTIMDKTIKFTDQDHTLGNLLRSELIEDPDVIFAAYKKLHPMFREIELRVQTLETTVDEALDGAISRLTGQIDEFVNKFECAQK